MIKAAIGRYGWSAAGAVFRRTLSAVFSTLYEEYLNYTSHSDAHAGRRRVPRGLSSSEHARYIRDLLTVRPAELDNLPDETLHQIDVVLQVRSAQHSSPLVPVESVPTLHDRLSPSSNLPLCLSRISFCQGDITRLSSPSLAIVNAANTRAVGCFQPSHLCIDNVIHAAAGPRLRRDCAKVLEALGRGELEVGEPIVTKAWSLPSGFVLHVAGPQLRRGQTPGANDEALLADAYRNSLDLAEEVRPSAL